MVLTHPFFNPTRIIQGHAFEEALFAVLRDRRWALVTSQGWIARGAVKKLMSRCGKPMSQYFNCGKNPDIQTVLDVAAALKNVDVYVGLGGGSVIDALKGAAVLCALGNNIETFLSHLREETSLPNDLPTLPIIAIPTTSGTGSEVTPWGTIWGEQGIKHSVNDISIYPSHTILDPALTTTMPSELTIATGLDALSHAMEAVWNRRHTALSDAMASQAISMIRVSLLNVLRDPNDLAARRQMQTASTIAGLAMGTTQTALAHSISYPFTSRFGMPHGLACSFTLGEIARYNMETDANRLEPIASGMDCQIEEIPVQLENWFNKLGLPKLVLNYITPNVTDDLDDNFITRARAANNIREVDGSKAREIARLALDRLNKSASDNLLKVSA